MPVTRRDFIAQSSLLVAGSMLSSPAFANANAFKYKMGLQLFSIRDALAKDLPGTLKEVALMGYQDLEIYGYEGDQDRYYKIKSVDFKKLLDDLQLTTSSGHYGLNNYFDKPEDDLMRYVDQCIVGAKTLNQKYITWPWLDPKFRTLDGFKSLAQKLNKIGERVTEAGLGFAYHNHDFEFIDHDGENGYNIIMRDADPSLVKLQLDMYWAVHSSKLSPAELIKKQPERFVMWHIKDMDKVTRDYSEMGNGSIDYNIILNEASQVGLKFYFIEQGGNYAKNSMQSMRDSAAFFKQNLQKYL